MNGNIHVGDSIHQGGAGSIGKIQLHGKGHLPAGLRDMISLAAELRERASAADHAVIDESGGANVAGNHGTIGNGPPAAGRVQANWPASQAVPQASPPGQPRTLAGHAFLCCDPANELQADQFQHSLETAGIPVWRDTRNLTPGQDRSAAIRQAITTGTLAFIACFSRVSLSRDRSRQRQDLSLAAEELRLRDPARAWLIPVRFDDCAIPDLDIGSGRTLASLHSTDLFGHRSAENLARLVTALQAILGPASS